MKWIKKLYTAQKIKFPIKDFFSKCDQFRIWSHLLRNEEILNGKVHFLCGVSVIRTLVMVISQYRAVGSFFRSTQKTKFVPKYK